MPFQFLRDCLGQVLQLFRKIENHSFLVLVFLHSPNLFIEGAREFFSQEVPDIL
jgi:hypothetical protein